MILSSPKGQRKMTIDHHGSLQPLTQPNHEWTNESHSTIETITLTLRCLAVDTSIVAIYTSTSFISSCTSIQLHQNYTAHSSSHQLTCQLCMGMINYSDLASDRRKFESDPKSKHVYRYGIRLFMKYEDHTNSYTRYIIIFQINMLVLFCMVHAWQIRQIPRPKASTFYRAMHFSAKRGIAIVCCLSVCL